jgi:hypothetical protein
MPFDAMLLSLAVVAVFVVFAAVLAWADVQTAARPSSPAVQKRRSF